MNGFVENKPVGLFGGIRSYDKFANIGRIADPLVDKGGIAKSNPLHNG